MLELEGVAPWPGLGVKKEGLLSTMLTSDHLKKRPDYETLGLHEPFEGKKVMGEAAEQDAGVSGPAGTSQASIERSPLKSVGALSEPAPVPRPLQAPRTSTQQSPAKPVAEASGMPRTPDRTSLDPVNESVVFGPEGRKLTVPAACRAHVIAAIASEFSIPAEEQHLLQESSDRPGVEYYRVERKMDPRKLRYTQWQISGSFRDGRPIYQLLNDLNSHRVDPLRELEPLDVVWHEGFWRSLSNRRLWALKTCAVACTDQPLFVRVRVRQPDAEFRNKCSSTNDGVWVEVGSHSRSPSPASRWPSHA